MFFACLTLFTILLAVCYGIRVAFTFGISVALVAIFPNWAFLVFMVLSGATIYAIMHDI